MVGWHHRLNGHQFEQALGVGDGHGSLASCRPRGHKESDSTEQRSSRCFGYLSFYPGAKLSDDSVLNS